MKNLFSGILAAGLIAATVTASHAGGTPLTSPVLVTGLNNASSGTLICQALNAGSKDLTGVVVDIVDASNGSTLSTSGPTDVAHGTSLTASLSVGMAGGHDTYCRATGLTVKNGTLSYLLKDFSGNPILFAVAP